MKLLRIQAVLFHALEDKLSRPESARQASVWQPRAVYIKLKSTEIINYIEALTKELKEEAGLKIKNGREVFQEDNLDAVSRLFSYSNINKIFCLLIQN
jgi:8-oxo-dGTP pyrophosphatase MutT (NUDIX family)